jgi:hypothetical protein
MSELVNPGDFAQTFRHWQQKVDRELLALARQRRLESASMRNGTISILDDAGTTRVEVGLLPNGQYGVNAYNADGVRTFTVGDAGLVRPAMILDSFDSFDLSPPHSITSGTFGSYNHARAPFVLADGLVLSVNVGSDVGTTGELQVVVVAASGNVTSNVFTIQSGLGGGAGGTAQKPLKWVHGLTMGATDLTLSVQTQVRRASGGGNVYIAPNNFVYFVDATEFSATMGGSWS